MKNLFSGVVGFILVLTLFSFGVCQERLTITTYYPSPYGVYKELRTDQISVGSGYRGYTLNNGVMLIETGLGIGLGNANPTARLEVIGKSFSPNEFALKIKDSDGKTLLSINNAGAVGIGGDADQAANNNKLTINTGGGNPNAIIFKNLKSEGSLNNDDEVLVVLGDANAVNVAGQVTGKVVSKSYKPNPSSRRYKTNIRPLEVEKVEKVLELTPVRFNWKSDGKEDIGLVAEDVEGVIKDLVTYNKEGLPEAVKYEKVALYLLLLVKKQQSQIEELKSQINQLKKK